MDKITASHFTKLMMKQPYFVWNSLDDNEELEDNDLKFQIPSFLDDLEVLETTYSEIQTKSFGIIEKHYKEWIINRFDGVKFLNSKSYEDKIEETKTLIKDPSTKYIYNPAFGFEHKEYLVSAGVAIYDVKDKILYFQKFSTSTKRKDFLKLFFDTEVVLKSGFPVEEVAIHTLAVKEYKKGEISFHESRYINTNKTGRSNSPARKSFDYLSHQLAKAGMSSNAKGLPFESSTILQLIKNPALIDDEESFSQLEDYLDRIIYAKSCKDHKAVSKYDNSIWGDSQEWKELISIHSPEIAGISGNLYSKKDIVNGLSLDAASDSVPTLAAFIDNNNPVINDEAYVKKIVTKLQTQKVIWYDFEAFSLPMAPMDDFLPFEQIVSQVSVIATNAEKEIGKNNLVIDPKNVSLDSFIEIITTIYQPNHLYVVYNQGYENSRLKEMVRTLYKHEHPRANEMNAKVSEIIENTIDLADMFNCSKNKLPKILIPELKGLYSIKLLEKYINNKYKDFHYKIKEYKNLEIKHGMMAMEAANNRALGITGDLKWATVKVLLKEYCENDVRAMIMVYHLIKELIM